jgi:thiamine kinase-like enzyme
MCHLDIAPRNILYLPDSSICLIDWATAGFYPRLFEVCILNINNNGQNGKFEEMLLKNIGSLTSEEEEQMWLLIPSFQNSLRYHFVSSTDDMRSNFALI